MNRIKKIWMDSFAHELKSEKDGWWSRKKELWKKREAKIVHIKGKAYHYRILKYDSYVLYEYLLYLSFLTKQKADFFQEEHVIPFQFQMKNGKIIDHKKTARNRVLSNNHTILPLQDQADFVNQRFSYDRLQAVKYAERWWNSYNPQYKQFLVDCTNYVSQCLRAGGAPMRGMPDRNQGWWFQDNHWSYSWSVAHSFRWYLSGSREGLQGKEVETAKELNPGDVICYDFEGDGRWDHNTIVVAKDAVGEPLVNAHTYNSRHRYWSYEDSTAWTPHIKYKFFQIG